MRDEETKARVRSTERKTSLAQKRSYASLIAMISDDAEVQALLPQILVSNGRVLPQDAHTQVLSALEHSPSFCCWRRKSSWIDTSTFVAILKILHRCLKPIADNIHVILLVDCCPVHASARTCATAARFGFRLVMIPANMTSLLQPLDVYCFAGLKQKHRDAVDRAAMRGQDGGIEIAQHFKLLFDCVAAYVNGTTWTNAFRRCGFGDDAVLLGSRLRRKLQWPFTTPAISTTLPSLSDLQAVWLRGKTIPIDALFYLAKHQVAHGDIEVEEVTTPPCPWVGRLRSTSAQGAPPPDSQAVTEEVAAAPWQRPVPTTALIPRAKRLWGFNPAAHIRRR